jgi:DNA-binding CsgD family transcriptional regulator
MQFRVIDGLHAFADRARRELLAAGETVRRRIVETAEELTPREAQIARLAWDGPASPEISTRLFIGRRAAGWHLRTVQSPEPPGLRGFGQAYPGRPEQVRRVRADLGAILNGCPVAGEAILVASELAANAVTHSSSRLPGGQFVVRAEVCPGDCVWVEVEDQGDIWAGHHPRDGRPHGLDIVQAIAGDGSWGIDGDAALGRVAWARLDWPGR